jgi:hypothetical protein
MTSEEEKEFRATRHEYYKLGKAGIEVLQSMGFVEADQPMDIPKERQREILFEIAEQGRLPELRGLIEQKGAEIEANRA